MLLQIKRLIHVIIYLLNTSGLKESDPTAYYFIKDRASEINKFLHDRLGDVG